jgi:hypothetical protein
MRKAGLPATGEHAFKPEIARNRAGDRIIEKKAVATGPKKGKRGYVVLQQHFVLNLFVSFVP